MPALSDQLRRALAALAPGARLCVAFSGGLDSTVLLHALAALRARGAPFVLRAIHIDHGLQADSGSWAVHCAAVCAALGVPFEAAAVAVPLASGDGLEAAARDARYAALEARLAGGEYLLTAHHQQDQVETVLLGLLRGAGAAGLSGIAARRRFGPGYLLRPLLGMSRHDIAAYARENDLAWIDDPSNLDEARDRNYLRHRVIPVLLARWPGAHRAIGRAARLQGEALGLLGDLAQQDAASGAWDGERFDTAALQTLGSERARNLVRYVLAARGVGAPPDLRLREGLAQLLGAPADRMPLLAWPGGQLRRYRGHLYLLPADFESQAPPPARAWNGEGVLDLGPAAGLLELVASPGEGLRRESLAGPLEVRFRQGGERLRLPGRRHRSALKDLLHDAGIVPWMRGQVPLIYAGGQLAAVADLWTADGFQAAPGEPGLRVAWTAHGPLR